jgi:16S rRNA (cytidine1402-2'-O)-methyltransferase
MLYVVATPIGNLDDFSMRAVSTLRSVDVIFAEDTRVTRVLLEKYNIQKTIISYHQHSDEKKIREIISLLEEGKDVALVTDAGTPGISDPGNHLISQILEELPELKIIPIPGPSALISALSISGFPTDKFVFLGFPPHKKGRQTFFKKIYEINETVAFYESKHRILKAMTELDTLSQLGYREIMVARELTKQFESVYRGTVQDVTKKLKSNEDHQLGEFVVVIRAK